MVNNISKLYFIFEKKWPSSLGVKARPYARQGHFNIKMDTPVINIRRSHDSTINIIIVKSLV